MSKSFAAVSAFAALLTLPLALPASHPAWGHHSHAMFDSETTFTITGTVANLDWTNPHVWLHVSAPDESGEMVQWALEMGSPANIARRGWRPRIVNPGDTVSVALHPLRDGGTIGSLVGIVLPDGTILGDAEYLN